MIKIFIKAEINSSLKQNRGKARNRTEIKL